MFSVCLYIWMTIFQIVRLRKQKRRWAGESQVWSLMAGWYLYVIFLSIFPLSIKWKSFDCNTCSQTSNQGKFCFLEDACGFPKGHEMSFSCVICISFLLQCWVAQGRKTHCPASWHILHYTDFVFTSEQRDHHLKSCLIIWTFTAMI